MRAVLVALVLLAAPPALARGPECAADLDACVRYGIAENAAFIDECGKIYPKAKTALDAAFRNWPVLKLPIPRLEEVALADSPLRLSLGQKIGPYLRAIPVHERQIECDGRFQMMLAKKPILKADSVVLPDDALNNYEP
jgi:hypothetical protein